MLKHLPSQKDDYNKSCHGQLSTKARVKMSCDLIRSKHPETAQTFTFSWSFTPITSTHNSVEPSHQCSDYSSTMRCSMAVRDT